MTGLAQAETRTLKLFFAHTGERAQITYKRNGKFVPSGMAQINRFLRDWRKNEDARMDPRVVDLLWEVYNAVGARDYITIVSAYRSPATNNLLRSRSSGVAKNSQHMLGKAIDFFIPGVKLSTLRRAAMRFQVGGVGYYPKSGSPFIHIDVGNARYWPRMSRQELMAMFPDGKTVYIPSDGKPLPGYQMALAAYKERRRDLSSIQVASASDTDRPRGLLASLFGGGADEEEDSAQDSTPAAAPVATAGQAAVAAARKEPEPATPEAILAALPAEAIPLPGVAPRPQVDVGVPVAVAEAQPAAQEDTVEFLLAENVPLPTPRPVDAPVAEQQVAMAEVETDEIAAQIAGVPVSGTRVMASMTGASAPAEPSATLAAYLPVPSERSSGGEEPVMIAALPRPRPTLDAAAVAGTNPEAAQARQEAKQMIDERLARLAAAPRASPRLALISRDQETDPAEVLGAGPRTTTKGPRPTAADDKPDPRSIPTPVPMQVARWALSNEPVTLDTRGTTAPSFAHALVRTAPQVVYTAGFQTASVDDGAINRFTGPAVVFLSVARFSTN